MEIILIIVFKKLQLTPMSELDSLFLKDLNSIEKKINIINLVTEVSHVEVEYILKDKGNNFKIL